MRTPIRGEVWVEYGQTYVESDPDCLIPELREAFAGQTAGLCGAATPGFLWLTTGLHTGSVGFTVEVHDEEPALDPEWEEVVEASFRPVSERTRLSQWAGEAAWDLGLAVTDHRVRYCARGFDEGRRRDTRSPEDPPADTYLLQFWPAPPAPDRVIRQTSPHAACHHDHARELPPPLTPEERTEAERRAREAKARAAEQRRLHRERWEWGGRLPSATLRAVGGNVRGLLRFDPDLVHNLDAAGPGVQRRVAVRAAHRACEAAELTDVPWIAGALTALTEGRPLPPPFDGPDESRTAMWDALRTDPRVPGTSVLEARPPERPPYQPPEPHPDQPMPAPRRADSPRPTRQGLGRYLSTLTPTPPTKEQFLAAYAEIRPADEPRPPHRISQPHYALPAIPAAAGPDPLRAALDAVWHALGTHGEHYPDLLAEVRALCGEGLGPEA
ncbi:hypothetical protein SUDANB145_02983 [Streptomyces sp. enrichment culture]|uniref:hypothetical protein n=1 Tax=Streptomyces sp. enrichment culture TaxID=1795815 RepID=UPI003F56150E